MVKTALGGRIAEELFYDSVTTGASDDINKVTQIVNGLVQTYGMTNNIGLVGYGSMMGEDSFNKPYSDQTNWEIDEEIRSIVKEQYQLAKDILSDKKDLVEALGERLLEKETINLPDIIDVLGERPYGMNETMKEYLTELREREVKEAALKMEETVEEQNIEDTLAEEVKEDADETNEKEEDSNKEEEEAPEKEDKKNKDDK